MRGARIAVLLLVAAGALSQALGSVRAEEFQPSSTGTATPDWVLQVSGGGIPVINPYGGTSGTAGAFWTPTYAADYDQFEQLLAARYASVPNVAEVVVSRCALFYPEPFLIGTSVAQNDTNLLAAGYTEATDQQCQQEEIDTAGADLPATRIGVSFDPYQTLAPSSNSKGYVTGVDVMVGTVDLDELAADDTTVPYGDVGSVPFDTVTAVITWPTGVTSRHWSRPARAHRPHRRPAVTRRHAPWRCTAADTPSPSRRCRVPQSSP